MSDCGECGFDSDAVGFGQLPALYLATARAITEMLGRAGDDVALRPSPLTWSPLEYACHVRDVFLIERDRGYLALVESCPSFARMYGDERAKLARYAIQPPSEVAAHLEMAATLLAKCVASLSSTERRRQFVYNYPSPQVHDLDWLARHSAHEGRHHLFDIERIEAQHHKK